LAALLHGTLVVGVSQTAALNRERHLYSAGRPSRAFAHISSFVLFLLSFMIVFGIVNAVFNCGVLMLSVGWRQRNFTSTAAILSLSEVLVAGFGPALGNINKAQ